MNKEIETQVVVLGSGPAGYTAAFRCADLGLKTVLIEKYSTLGGVCLNVGCIPSKYLLYISEVINDVKGLSSKGIDFGVPNIDLSKIRFWKNKILDQLTNGLNTLAKHRNIVVLHGSASFNTRNSIIVDNNHTNICVHFSHAIIATGSKSIKSKLFPRDNTRIWDSTDALNVSMIPKRFLIVGAGIIGLEMATFYSALGSNIDVIDSSSQLLPFLDRDIIAIFKKGIKKQFNLILNAKIEVVESRRHEVYIKMKDNNKKEFESCYDAVLVAIGRRASCNNLGLEQLGVQLDNNGFIIVDKQLKTNIKNIYAIGDVLGHPMLAHKGIYQANIAAEVISGKNHYFEPKVIPAIAYTYPELSWVGVSEEEAIKFGIDYVSAVFPWKASGKALVSNSGNGMTKLIFDKKTNRIIGGSLVGKHSGELLGEIGLAIEMGCDAEDLALTIHAHPTLYESIGLSAKIFQGTITDILTHN
ncbi:Dihydrolipoyl dehydrogenase [Buchnera aphidicola (Eriosoma lanigerum)]|uniref:dihydrolipoyl dehydrogenase n=1 Tax=Buchnera aphidicola TaxID=9 RepID=UPI003464AB02